ncbi:DUF1833 family protein [Pseudoxanthomonas winnipegensis]|uniref:DUF1833 domain-containing protein n=1 Tax=Pseudoxanthomonas winnipegensis TaxID=2480810 RepID=A0ABY1WB08_9GAMM|nr:DUF1833 family protein [Pseudoxanthomonas winnipegensis]RZZ81936.1 DUF1833 domain-containing protein [Pseudoxanthomonas winnipegensis]TAA18192.1 DUF1833 domain-containing protein [Pseudoxanthomonas winnipegensis]TAA42198.1 DUF1833 domain-containing protein [Pseudoxanthomonas winnipegensis]TBV72305.1 DUF1833 domain-containing protein [Pseudoxanthomonas winnipegensis]
MTSAAFVEQIQRVTDTDGIIALLQITCDAWSGPLLIANDTKSWTSNGLEYLGFQFGFTLLNDVAGETPRTSIVITNVGRGLTEELERVGPNELVMAKMMLASRADPDKIEETWVLPMSVVSVEPERATAQCGMDFLMRQQAMNKRFTPELTPGVH